MARCTLASCRTKLVNPMLAHTPIWHHNKGGSRPFAMYLRALYTLGQKTPLDAAAGYIGCGRDSAKNWYGMLKTALAFAELHTGEETEFPPGALEFDGAKTVVKKASRSKNTHCGRFIVCVHRETGKYSLQPITDADVAKGAPPPPESLKDASAYMDKKVRPHHIISNDSARGLVSAAKRERKKKGVLFTYVVHSRHQYVKLLRIPLTRLSPAFRDVAATISETNQRYFKFKAGSNMAEATFSAIKRNIRRLNLQSSGSHAQVNALAAAWLQKNVGLEGVMKAIRIYQKTMASKTSPLLAFKDLSWMKPEEHEDAALSDRALVPFPQGTTGVSRKRPASGV